VTRARARQDILWENLWVSEHERRKKRIVSQVMTLSSHHLASHDDDVSIVSQLIVLLLLLVGSALVLIGVFAIGPGPPASVKRPYLSPQPIGFCMLFCMGVQAA
jgi:hypothetical protein